MFRQFFHKLCTFKDYVKKFFIPEIYWLSLGENCLSDDILKRHGLKSFNTIYSSARSNVDYAIYLEKRSFQGFLDRNNLEYDYLGNLRVTRSTLCMECGKLYLNCHSKGFETSHHDLINNEAHRQSFQRKIQRMLDLRNNKKTVFFYHHRVNDRTNLEALFIKLETFSTFYSRKPEKCQIMLFVQSKIINPEERKVIYRKVNSNIHLFEFKTINIWEGSDPEIFWARCDDDLIKKMLETSVRIIKRKECVPDGIIY